MTDQRDPRRRSEPPLPPNGRPGAQRFGPSSPAARPEGQYRDQGLAGPAYDADLGTRRPDYGGADPGYRAGRAGYPSYEPQADRPSAHEPELLTHEQTSRGAGAPIGARRAMPTRVEAGPYDEPERRSAGGLPPLPPVGGRGGSGGGGSRPPRRSVGTRIRRLVFWLIGLVIFGPILAFAIGWFVVPIPTANEIATSQVATVVYADGSVLATVRPSDGARNRVIIPLSQVPPTVRYAVLSAEDRSFYSNPGFDPIGIVRAAWNQLHGVNGGGSTITQQYIKISTRNDQHTLWRKYKEVIEAAKISKVKGKDEILGDYLNTIYLGRGAYGIQAAAKAYFGVDASQLTVSQGALLAGLIQSPSRWDQAKSTQRWNYVLDGMVAQGWLDKADRDAAVFPDLIPAKPITGGIPGDHLEHIYNQVKAELAIDGISDQELNTEGLKITTTIDPNLEKQAAAIANKVLKVQPKNLRGALVAVDPATGEIRAYWGGETGVGLDYGQVFKQPGSSFKPFVMAAALQHNPPIGLGEKYQGTSPMTIAGQTVSNSDGDSCDACDLKTAMTKSINTVYYRLAVDVGPQAVADAAHAAGIPTDLLPTPTAGIALGDKEVHPQDMASAYATFANNGLYEAPHLITRVEAADGSVLYTHPPTENQAFSQQVARNVTESMLNVASGSLIPLAGGRPVAAKTGTTQNRVPGQNNDAWTVGYVPTLSTAVWVGTDDNSPIKNSAGRPIYGRMVAGDIWQQFMNTALRNVPIQNFGQFDPIGKAPSDSDNGNDSDSDDNGDGDDGDDGDGDGDGHHHRHHHHGDDGQNPCDFTRCDDDGNPVAGHGDRSGDNGNDGDDGDDGGNN